MEPDISGYGYFGINNNGLLGSFEHIVRKLEEFTRKYYTKLLVKGLLLFITWSTLLFLLITGVEYFFWLGSVGRLILLLVLVVLGLLLAYFYLLVPILYLLKIKKGISAKDASRLIGKHFPAVGDKLQNLLELKQIPGGSDLLLAAIEQRSREMRPVSFKEAVKFRESYTYFKYLLVPLVVLGLIWISGSVSDFFKSYERVVHYDLAYTPPAPFVFELRNESLTILEGEPLTVTVTTEGDIRPQGIEILVGGKRLTMQQSGGVYEYTMQAITEGFTFYFLANEVRSRDYEVRVIRIPVITNFVMYLDYPGYLDRSDKEITGTGNARVPEGTRISWKLKGINTSKVDFVEGDSVVEFEKRESGFLLTKPVFNDLTYTLSTSNERVQDFEKLTYNLKVIKDESPALKVTQQLDSLNPNLSFYEGLGSDDYGIAEITMSYYPIGEPEEVKQMKLMIPESTVQQFYYTFPTGLAIEPGKEYELYFEIRDNDPFRGGKVTRSQVFRTSVLDDNQLEERRLENQEDLIKGLSDTLKEQREQQEQLDKLNDQQRQNSKLDFSGQQKIKEYLKRQQLRESMMEKFTRELKENIAKREGQSEMDELLLERLARQEMEAKKNQELLEKLNEVASKIEQEKLQKKLEELAKSQSSNVRNLEQLVELTKRYYVTEKAAQLAQQLKELAEEQEKLSDEEINKEYTEEQQNALNEQYEVLEKALEELKRDNEDLKKPLDLGIEEGKEKSIAEDQKEALEEIRKHQSIEETGMAQERKEAANKASDRQKSAASKMKELSEQMQEGANPGAGGSSITEDAEMLRQILDNLLVFSFEQEQLFNTVEEDGMELREFSGTIKKQKELQGLFGHIDDSLFALSLRRAELAEFVNEQITEVYYNMDKSLEGIAENQIYQAASYQQYTFTAANALAEFLADILDNMQQSMMSGKGQGQGEGFQLPDIIKSQQQLQEKMEGGQGSSKGEESGQGNEGEKGQEQSGTKGRNGSDTEGDGDQGKEKGKTPQGQDGGQGASGDGFSEEQLKEIYEIYKEQQTIREQLEEQLKNIIDEDKRGLAKKLTLEMERFEQELLENGITRRTIDRMNRIQHQLLKLENAAMKQGERKERESNSANGEFGNPVLTKPELLKNRKSTIEILNRQALPLQPRYQDKVKRYFKNGY